MENDKEKTMRQTLRETVKTTRYMLKFVCRDGQGKLYLFLKGVSALLDALFPLVYVVFPGLIINELSGDRRLDVIVLFVGLLAGLPVVNRVLEQFMKKAIYRLEMALELKHSLEFKSFVADMDYETLEDPEIQAMKERAFNTNGNMLNVANHLSQLSSSVIGLVALSSIIVTLNPLLIALIVGVAYVNSLFSKRINYKIFLLNKELSKRDSFDWAYYYMLERFEYAKEIRLFSIKNLLINILRTR
ncbi:MAG: hypothetical protein LBC28_00925, partial [Oscillospiraceae bacterium]|nr:hypothetical protein [Oscillospiraceae bacterium]